MQQTFEWLNEQIGIAYQYANSPISHCGWMIDAGTRDELPNEHGMAHFLEHTLFKGTQKRSAFQILNRLEVVGGELNAYTTKEKTAVYASILDKELPRAIDLLSDIVFNASFPEKEINKEKGVVIDEINTYLDIFEETIFDHFEHLWFPNHPLGHYILGTADSVSNFNRNQVIDFYTRNYLSNRMVFSYVGPRSIDYIRKLLFKCQLPYGPISKSSRQQPNDLKSFSISECKNTTQAYLVLGYPSIKLDHLERATLLLLNNILGSDSMNARLNLSLRERHGLVYSIESSALSFTDNGMFTIYACCDAKKLPRVHKLILSELDKIRSERIAEKTLSIHKKQFQARIAMSEESRQSLMLSLAKSLLDLGKIDTLDEVLAQIDDISPDRLRDLAAFLFKDLEFTRLQYLPEA
jgi:predicted Zn-dependent peptidase